MSKSKSGDNDCLCSSCPERFVCFTQERVFSDAMLQGLFEALIAEGKSKKDAIWEVKSQISSLLRCNANAKTNTSEVKWVYDTHDSTSAPKQWDVEWYTKSDFHKADYTIADGRELNWNVKTD